MLDARWSFHGLNQIFIGDRVSSSSCRRVYRDDGTNIDWLVTTIPTNRGCQKEYERCWRVLHIQLLSSVLLISPFGIRPPFGYRIFSANSKFRSMLWSMLYPILVEMIRFKEILYIDCAPISISYDFPLVEKCSDDKRWKIVGRKLSRVSTYILRYTGLMLRYQMWNIFMVSP